MATSEEHGAGPAEMTRIESKTDPMSILSVIRQIHEEYWGGRYSFDPKALAEKLATFGECLFAKSEVSGKMLGGVFGYCNNLQDKIGYISFIGRIKDAPRGTGFLLHQAFVKLALSRGMERTRLEVVKENIHAKEFYHRLGYVPIEDHGEKLLLEARWDAARIR